VLGQRHQLDVREPELANVLDEQRRDLAIREQAAALAAPPRAEVALVDL